MKMPAVMVPPVLASHIYRLFIWNKLPFSILSIIMFWLYEELFMRCISYFQLCVCMSISEVTSYLSLRMKLSCTAAVIFHLYESEMHLGSAFRCVNKCGSSQGPLTVGCCLSSPLFTYYSLSNASVRIWCRLSSCGTLRHQEANLATKIKVPFDNLACWNYSLMGIKARKRIGKGQN